MIDRKLAVTLAVVVTASMLISEPARGERFESLAPYANETEAIDAGKRIGIGQARLEGPEVVEVLSHQSWTYVYTVGAAGIKPGGGLRIAMRHLVQWSSPQTERPGGAGYLTASSSPAVPLQIYIEFNKYDKRFFKTYHPWQNIVEIVVAENGLNPGDEIRVRFGDSSEGSPGMRVQPFDERDFTFKGYVDPFGQGDYWPMADNPTIDIVAAEARRLGVVTPSDAVTGRPTWCIVRAEDKYGNPAASYRGTIELMTGDEVAELPASHTFTAADRGVHRFSNVVFNTTGDYLIKASDGAHEPGFSNPVRVRNQPPDDLLLWGDLHGHTLFSDGRGTVEEFYDFAERVAGLDFCAVTDHAFQVVDWMWEESKRATNAAYKPGQFVTFQAYEWSGLPDVGGDHNVYWLDDNPPIYRSRSYYNYDNLQMYHGTEPQVNHVEDLFVTLSGHLDREDVFCIPHWGGRHGNASFHSPRVQRMIEVFSEHRRSEDWITPFLKKGHRLGIMASTDGHYGNPGYGYLKPTYDWSTQEIGMASVAVYAPIRTREAIFKSLYDRRVYATTGDRTILDVTVDGHPMGSEYRTVMPPKIHVYAVGTNPIARIEIKKNSEVVHVVEPARLTVDLTWTDESFEVGQSCYYYVRVIQEDREEAISSPVWIN